MGKRGPAPTPTNLRLVRGETRPSRINRSEPKAPVADPVGPPDYLDADAIAVWERLAPSLVSRGVLTAWDVDTFAVFCTAVVHHRRAAVLVNSTGVLIAARGHNTVVKHPAMQVLRDNAAIVATLAGRFGLTPSDRSSIQLPEGSNDEGRAAAILD